MASGGWIDADRLAGPGADLVGDIRDGLRLADASIVALDDRERETLFVEATR